MISTWRKNPLSATTVTSIQRLKLCPNHGCCVQGSNYPDIYHLLFIIQLSFIFPVNPSVQEFCFLEPCVFLWFSNLLLHQLGGGGGNKTASNKPNNNLLIFKPRKSPNIMP